MDPLVAARQIDAHQRELLAPPLAKVDALACVVELRLGAALAHEAGRLGPVRRDDINSRVLAKRLASLVVAAHGAKDDERAVG